MTPKIAIIIVSWNVREYTLACVRALMAESVEKEIVVVDNASADGTVDALNTAFPELRVIANTLNRGFAAAVNQGVAITSASIIFVLNPDTAVHAGALQKLIARFNERGDVGIIGAHLVSEQGETVPSVRANPSVWSQTLVLLRVHRLFPMLLSHYFERDFDYTKEQTVEQVMGSAMAIRRELWNALGGFDERFFIWFEEVDFCKRAHDSGRAILYAPHIVVTDFAGKSFVQVDAKTKARYFTNSLNSYAKKHFSVFGQQVIRLAGFAHRLFTPLLTAAGVKPQPRPR